MNLLQRLPPDRFLVRVAATDGDCAAHQVDYTIAELGEPRLQRTAPRGCFARGRAGVEICDDARAIRRGHISIQNQTVANRPSAR